MERCEITDGAGTPDADALMSDVAMVYRLVRTSRLDLSNEKAAQASMETVFSGAGMNFRREFRLSDRDVPDFMFDSGLAVEAKVLRAKRMEVFKQLCRYASHDAVRAVMLVSGLSMGLPEEIKGKPAYFASIGTAWL